MSKNDNIYAYGLTRGIVEHISKSKYEPKWMLEKRLEAFSLWENSPLPNWGPSLKGLDMDNMIYYSDPDLDEKNNWEDVPEEIKETFDNLGIQKAEKEYLGGVGAQYDSGMVYHKLQESLKEKGVIFENMDVALQKYPDMVKKYFMTTCVQAKDHKFTMLHGAVWSGGTFIYVPKGVSVGPPLQAYFRMNKEMSGQFEHTLIIADAGSDIEYIEGCSAPQYNSSSLHAGTVEVFVHKNAKVRYISIENWSRNTYNLNTKRAMVYENGEINWIGGNMGSGVTMLYPTSVLLEPYAKSEYLGIAIAGKGQVQDTGSKVIHLAPHTRSVIRSKSIAKDGGAADFRGLIKVSKKATDTVSSMVCDSLLLDKESTSNSYPTTEVMNDDVSISHEARIGKIGEKEIFYLQTRGFCEEDAVRLVVGGYASPIIKALPLEYAVEMNKLIDLEME